MFDRTQIKHAVRLDDPSLSFNASHAIFYKGANGQLTRESEHRHDFRASLRVEGPLDETCCVIDFLVVQKTLRDVLDGWNGARIVARSDKSADDAASKGAKIRRVDALNATTEAIADAILLEFVQRLAKTKTVPERRVKQYAFTLSLEEARGCYAEASIGK
ncbi:MAG: 6-carboxytetrahydropterin synthase [Thermoguttaceae bacterium]|nr:6-carboxytetrahydropterin synthase [Thermoguttaceae bacterium]